MPGVRAQPNGLVRPCPSSTSFASLTCAKRGIEAQENRAVFSFYLCSKVRRASSIRVIENHELAMHFRDFVLVRSSTARIASVKGACGPALTSFADCSPYPKNFCSFAFGHGILKSFFSTSSKSGLQVFEKTWGCSSRRPGSVS